MLEPKDCETVSVDSAKIGETYFANDTNMHKNNSLSFLWRDYVSELRVKGSFSINL